MGPVFLGCQKTLPVLPNTRQAGANVNRKQWTCSLGVTALNTLILHIIILLEYCISTSLD